jgi:hypothetical protein
MQGGVYFSKDSKEILLNEESYYNAVYASDDQISEKYLSELDNSVKV